jgi:hypothetical protein
MPWLELYLPDLDRRLDFRVARNVGHYAVALWPSSEPGMPRATCG